MTIQDTYKFGSLYVDAVMTLERLEDRDALSVGDRAEIVNALKESTVDFTFDEDWEHGCMYSVDGQETPLVLIGTFGGYPGESIDEANLRAAKEWAEDRDYIYSFSSWFGGCEMVTLYLNFDDCTLEEAEEAIELVEWYREYPVLDEGLWSEIQWERWEEMIGEMLDQARIDCEAEWNHELTEDEEEQIRELAQEKYGYWEEGYFAEDEWNKIVLAVVNREVQQHQETQLW